MRAMPSPEESTKPVSRTSSCFSYSLIWSRMTSLISAARICIDLFPPGSLGATLGHLLAQAEELRLEASVVHRAVEIEHHAPQELGIHLGRREHLAAPAQAADQVDEFVLLGRAERGCRADENACPAEGRVDQLLVDAGDVGHEVETIPLGEQAEEVADARREAECDRDAARDADASAGIDGGASKDEPQARLLEHAGDAPELFRSRGERLARQRVQGAGIPLGEAPPAHYTALADSMKSRTMRAWSRGVRVWRSRAVACRTASSMSSFRSALRATTNSCSASTRASARIRSAASRPRATRCSRSRAAAA